MGTHRPRDSPKAVNKDSYRRGHEMRLEEEEAMAGEQAREDFGE